MESGIYRLVKTNRPKRDNLSYPCLFKIQADDFVMSTFKAIRILKAVIKKSSFLFWTTIDDVFFSCPGQS